MAVDWHDLTGFQRDVLAVVADLERTNDKLYGLAIKRGVETRYGTTINPGRLYQNLDDLVADGLLDKWFYDGRTNRYRLTNEGGRVMQSYAVQLFADLDGEALDNDPRHTDWLDNDSRDGEAPDSAVSVPGRAR